MGSTSASPSLKMSDRKAVIKNADMSEEMQQDAVDCATQALEKYNIEKDIAAFYQEGIRQKIQPYMACYRWPKLRKLCNPRDQALHLLLFGTGCHLAFQIRIKTFPPFIQTILKSQSANTQKNLLSGNVIKDIVVLLPAHLLLVADQAPELRSNLLFVSFFTF